MNVAKDSSVQEFAIVCSFPAGDDFEYKGNIYSGCEIEMAFAFVNDGKPVSLSMMGLYPKDINGLQKLCLNLFEAYSLTLDKEDVYHLEAKENAVRDICGLYGIDDVHARINRVYFEKSDGGGFFHLEEYPDQEFKKVLTENWQQFDISMDAQYEFFQIIGENTDV